jgi:broad specificity phosphatase PhoE
MVRITTNFPETLFFGSALLFALFVLIIGRILHVRRPPLTGSIHSPIDGFRREMASIANSTGDPLDRSVHAVRRYVCGAFDVGTNGMTNEELIAEFAEHRWLAKRRWRHCMSFLVGNDLLRFAPLAESSQDVLQRATELVEQLELRRVATLPPPLPVTS